MAEEGTTTRGPRARQRSTKKRNRGVDLKDKRKRGRRGPAVSDELEKKNKFFMS